VARLPSFSPERGNAVERALAMGASLGVAGASAGVSARTVSRWLEDGLVIRRELRAVPELDAAELPDDDEEIQRELLATVLSAARNGDWRAATWLLRQRWPQRYGR
jgi:hypothetical protein